MTFGYIGSWTENVTIGGTGSQSININQLPRSVPLTSSLRDQVTNPFYNVPGVGGTLGANRTVERAQLLRPFPQFTSVNMQRVHQGFGRYNALVVKGEKRSNNGLTLRANWTWSKNLDNVVGEDNFFSSESNAIRDAFNLKDEYAYSTIDTPHRVIITPIYQLPFGSGRAFLNGGGWTDKVLGGWTLSTIATFQTGFPITISQTTETTTAFGGSQRPIRVAGVDPSTPGKVQDRLVVPVGGSAYINRDAFMIAPALNFGNLARNIGDIRTPGQMNFNASLGKTTNITEGVKLTLRMEANNATNTPKFAGPNGNLSSGQFGSISSVTGFSRQIQWMARVHW
jgi:trimeric autotransporter adhesin